MKMDSKNSNGNVVKLITYCLFFIIGFISCTNSDDTEANPVEEIQKGKILKNINVNGITRDYIIYVPQSYTAEEAVPLLFAFHGLGGSMESSYENSKFYQIAENEGFILIHPDGVLYRWNVFSVEENADLDFVDQLIEELQSEYNIESRQIYSTGMSNGGYFSFLLACAFSDRIAAIGSVTGVMVQDVLNNCQPTRPVPILQVHGTEDMIVDYENVDEVLNYWINHNHTNTTPVIFSLPDTDTSDGSTVEKYVYANGDNNVEVHHLKIINGGHQWPGHQGNMDINASQEVWNFVKEYDINGKME